MLRLSELRLPLDHGPEDLQHEVLSRLRILERMCCVRRQTKQMHAVGTVSS